MSIGLCCQYLTEVKKGNKVELKNIFEEKHLLYSKKDSYSKDRIKSIWITNLSNLNNALDIVIQDGFKCFRLSSSLFPLYDLNSELLEDCVPFLNKIGDKISSNNIRITMHPSEWVILNSKNESVVEKSINDLKHHAWIMDNLNLSSTKYNTIMIHGGIKNNLNALIKNINNLPENIKSRLAIENDELSYNVKDLFLVYKETDCPIVFDSHHHSFNSGEMSNLDAFELSLSTWKVKGLNHLSNTEPGKENSSFQEKRKHSEYVYYIPEHQLLANNSGKIDLEFEFKAKQLAVKKAIKDFGIIL